MVDIVIFCPLAVEFWAVYRRLENPEERENSRLTLSYYVGSVSLQEARWTVALLETGPKIEDLKSVTMKVIDVLKPKYVFLTGVAGGVKDVALGDVVVATKAYGYESGKETSEGFLPRPDVVNHPTEILDLCRRLERKRYNQKYPYKVVFGPIASGNKVLASRDSETYRIIKKYYSDTIAVEMEAIGFAKAAAEAAVQFANIRGISDLLDDKSKSDKGGSQEVASTRAAAFVMDLIKLLPRASEEWSDDQNYKVRYLNKKGKLMSYRRPKKGELKFRKDYIEFKTKNETIYLKEIRHVEHVALQGDFAPNWVMIEYKNDDNWLKIFLSTVNPIGFGYWFGGSKQLLKNIEPYKMPKSKVEYEVKKDL